MVLTISGKNVIIYKKWEEIFMTYEKWLLLTDREKKKVPDEELPEIPLKMLKNGIVKVVAMRKDGKFGWETTQKVTNGRNTKWFPEYRIDLFENLDKRNKR